jgi:glycosyltransferase involved in cell wall biosynthesis
MSDKKRVMFISNSASGGGAERATNIIVDRLHKEGVIVALCNINSGGEDLVKPGCTTFEINRNPRAGLLSILLAFFKFKIIVRKWKPTVLVFGCELPELFAAMSGKKTQKLVVLHTSQPWLSRLLLGRIVRWRLDRQNVLWVAVSNHLMVWGSDRSPDTVIPNPVFIQKETVADFNFTAMKRFLYIGRLSEEKRPNWVLEVSNLTKYPSLFVGSGNLSERLKAFAENHSLDATFRGFEENPWQLVSNGDLLIIPSRFEGDGLVVLEAISHNIPFVLSDIPDFRRFDLPNHFYFKEPSDLVKKLSDIGYELDCFKIPEADRNRILKDRSSEYIGGLWAMYLSENV